MVVRGGRRDGPLLTKGIDRQTDITLYESRAAISDSWQTLEICKLLTYSSHSGYCVKIAHEQRKQGDQFWQVSEDCLLSICLCTSKKLSRLASVTGLKPASIPTQRASRTSKSIFLSLNSQSYFSSSRRQTMPYSSRTFDWRLAKSSPKLQPLMNSDPLAEQLYSYNLHVHKCRSLVYRSAWFTIMDHI